MPNDFMALDQNLPRFTGQEGLEERVKRLQDYQYQLLETLRYMMHHLDTRNFNQTELNRFVGTITDPINKRIADAEGNLAELTVTAKGIASRVRDAEGNISTLQQTASAIQTTVSSQAGDISTLKQTATAIQTTVSNQAGQISKVQQTVDGLTITIDGPNGSSSTMINGGSIYTDNMHLDTLYGETIFLKDAKNRISAEFTLTGASSYEGQKVLVKSGAIELDAMYGDVYLKGGDGTSLQIGGGNVQAASDLIPSRTNTYTCGSKNFTWRDIYSQDGAVRSSDGRGKKEIDYDMSRYSGLFDRLRPCSFLRTNGTSGRRHHGFIAQEVRAALEAEGMTGKDFAGYVDWEDGEEYGFGLRYEEMIAMVVYEVQEIKRKMAGG